MLQGKDNKSNAAAAESDDEVAAEADVEEEEEDDAAAEVGKKNKVCFTSCFPQQFGFGLIRHYNFYFCLFFVVVFNVVSIFPELGF